MQDLLASLPLGAVFAVFAIAAAAVWAAGSGLPRLASDIAERTGMGQAFGGLIVLGGITSLPELATTLSAGAIGAPDLALNNILGSVAFNIALLAVADSMLGTNPLTAVIARPATLMQGVLGMLVLAIVAAAAAAGEVAIGGLGVWSTILFAACVGAMWVAFRFERQPAWVAIGALPEEGEEQTRPDGSRNAGPASRLIVPTLLLAAVILVAGTVLSFAGDEIGNRTGIGGGLVGLLLLAAATSLPELGAVYGAVRLRRYELAIGQVFGSNLFNLSIIFLIDLASPTTPVLAAAGRFETVAATLGIALTGIFVVGLLERRDRKFLRMGYDSLAVLIVYGAGVALLSRIAAE